MKTKSLFISAFGVLAMSAMTLLSCTKDETEPTGDGNDGTPSGEVTAPVLSSDKESVVLAVESADQTAVTFSWTAAKDGESDADATYEIFINLSSKDIFTTPYRQELGSGLTASFTHAELNTILVEELGAEAGQAADIQVMVYATPAEGEGLQSNKAALNVTTYVEQIEFPESLILLGSATPALWEMANGIEVAKTSDGVYTVENVDLRGSGNSGFKFYFSRNDGDYRIQVDMANEDFKDLTIKIVIAKEDSQDIVPSRIAGYTDGQYKLTVNLNTLELTMERTGDLSEITLPDKLYMQGDAVEWKWTWNEENTLNKISDKVYEAKNIKLIDVGFDQKNSLPKQSCLEDIYNYGLILKEVLAVLPTKMPHLKHIADRCTDNNPRRRYQDVQELRLAIERRSSNSIYTAIIIFIVIMSILLAWLNSRNSPEHKQENVAIEATK